MNFIDRFFQSLRSLGDGEMFVEVRGQELVPTTAREALSMAAAVRSALVRHGVKSGDRVAVLAPNSTRGAAVDLGLLSVGVVSVPLYNRQAPEELAAMLNDAQPSLLIVSDAALRDAVTSRWKTTCPVALFGEIFAAGGDAPTVDVGPDEPVTIVYTSGTGGEAKGVVLFRRNIDFMLEQTAAYLEAAKGNRAVTDRVFHFLPTCFLGSRLMFWTQIFRGNPVMISTDLKNLAEEMATAAPDYFLTVPAVLDRIRTGVGDKVKEAGGLPWVLYRAATAPGGMGLHRYLAGLAVFPKIRARIGRNLRFIISGSAALSPETQFWFERLGLPVLQVYGLTETTGIVTMDRRETVRVGFVGKPIDGVDVRVSDDGELLCRGPNVFPGYWRKPEATLETVHNGWLRTGDRAEIAPDGNLRILGRVRNLLVPASGHNVAPEPIEQSLLERCRGLEHAFVVGHGRPYLGVLLTGDAQDEEIARTLDDVNSGLPHYRRIRKYARLSERFTPENGLLTANQKLRRNAIEERFRPEIETLYRGEA